MSQNRGQGLARRAERDAARGFTLVEIIVVIIIIGVLATLIAPRLLGRVGQSKSAAAASNAASLASAVKLYAADWGSLPPDMSALAVKGAGKGPYVDNADQLKDPWGNMYVLRVPPQKNADFDVVSYGKDNKPGGEDEDADVVKP